MQPCEITVVLHRVGYNWALDPYQAEEQRSTNASEFGIRS